MKHQLIACLLIFAGFTQFAFCQEKKNNDIVGAWKGTSLCQVKNSPCHDEVVVYHISKSGTDTNYVVQANKIVNGVEEDMGLLDFIYNKKEQTFICHYTNKRGDSSVWEFHITGNEMKGRLILLKDNTLFRLIDIKKEL